MGIKFDYSRLRGRIIEKYGTCSSFALAMGFTRGALSSRLKSLTGWKDYEIYKACDLLDIAQSDMPLYFFVREF